MSKFQYDEEPVIVSRDTGYNLVKLLSQEHRKKVSDMVGNQELINSKYKLKEIFAKFGVIVNPEAMTYLFNKD